MPRWTVQDDSGNTLVLEGDSEPTEQELEEIFSSQRFDPAADVPASFSPADRFGDSLLEGAAALVGQPEIDRTLPSPINPQSQRFTSGADIRRAYSEEPTPSPTRAISSAIFPESEPEESLLGISPEMIPSGKGPVTVPLASVARTATGIASYLTSPDGITELVASMSPAKLMVMGKWATDMAKGAGESLGNLSTLITKPNKTLEDWQELSDHTANSLAMIFGAGKVGSDIGAKATGIRAPVGRALIEPITIGRKGTLAKDLAQRLSEAEMIPLERAALPENIGGAIGGASENLPADAQAIEAANKAKMRADFQKELAAQADPTIKPVPIDNSLIVEPIKETVAVTGEPLTSLVSGEQTSVPATGKPVGKTTVQELRDRLLAAKDVAELETIMESGNAVLNSASPTDRQWLLEASEIRGRELTKNIKPAPVEETNPVGSFVADAKDSTGTWIKETVSVLSIGEPVKLSRPSSDGGWQVSFEAPSRLGKTGRQTRTRTFFKKSDALAWIDEVKRGKSASAPAQKPVKSPTTLQELDALVIQHGIETGRIDDLETLHAPKITEASGLGSMGLAAKRRYSEQIKAARQRIASDLGIAKDKLETPEGRAEILAKLKERIANPPPPKLRPGEKGTGELLQGEDAPFNLTGERAVDAERIAAEKKAKEESDRAAAEFEETNQTDMFPEGVGEASDWTRATEDISEVASEPSKPVPPPNIIEMGAGIPIPKFADRKMSPLDRVTTSHSGKLQKSFSEARLAQNEIKKSVPSERRQNAISIWREANGDLPTLQVWAAAAKGKMFKQAAIDAKSLTPKEIATANKTIAAFATLEKRGNTFDVLKSHRDNYVPHVWDIKRPGSGFGTGMLKQRFRFAKARTFATFFEGDQAGFKPKTLAIGKLLPAYIHEMNRVIADRQAVRDLAKGTMPDGSPMVVPKGNVKVVDGPSGKAVLVSPKAMRKADTRDYRVMADQPALSNWIWEGKDTDGKPVFVNADLAVHPDVYRRLTAILGQSAIRTWYRDPVSGTAQIPRAIVRGLDTAQSAMKREMFGLLAPFHQVQEGWHGIAHRINPLFGLEKIDLVKNSRMVDAANHGLMLLPDRASSRVYLEGVGTQSSLLSQGLRKTGKATAGVGEAIADVIDGYQDYLFHQYIPALKFKTYEAMVERNTKLYAKELVSGEMTEADIKLTSAEQSNAAYGHLNYALLDRNPTIQHLIQLSLLAPDFLEARARFAGQAVKGARSKVGTEQLKAIAFIAAVQAGSAFLISQLLGVPYDKEHPFEVIYKGRRFALRSVPEDIFGLVKDTRQFVYSRVNPLTVKGGVQLATGLNYRGEKVSATDTMGELLAGYIPITARSIPGVRSLTETGRQSPITPLQQLAGSLGLRVSRYSPISETYKLAGDWMDSQKLAKDRGSYPISKYQQLRYALEDGDMERAKSEYETLRKEMTAKKISDGFEQSINHPFTGSQSNDKAFSRSLKGYDWEIYNQALRNRRNILSAFKRL